MNKNKIQEFIDDSVQRNLDGVKSQPRFYVVSGSRLYGFESEDSDFDIRGFHTVPSDSYSYLNEPDKEIRSKNVSQNEKYDYELVSYELKKFGELLHTANYDIIEQVLCGDVIMNGVPLEMDSLRRIIRDHLPLDVPESYYGMAKNQYYKHLDDESDRYNPSPEAYLYVYRGLIGALYVQSNEDVIANIEELSSKVDVADESLVNKLIKMKKNNVNKVNEDLRSELKNQIIDLYSDIEVESKDEKEEYRKELNSWMKSIR